jgi:hypothetical protein
MLQTKQAHNFKLFWSHVSNSRLLLVCCVIFIDLAKVGFILLLSLYCLTPPRSAQATTNVVSKFELVCDAAAQQAAEKTGVPLDVLKAITRTETGLSIDGVIQSWPWTVNMQGRGFWFQTKSEALAYVFEQFKKGARSFDIGCFQINYRWHGASFVSIEDMFDPTSNAIYAAFFLKSLHVESGDWTIAAGAFHSRNSVRADRYMVRFISLLSELNSIKREEASAHVSATAGTPEKLFLLTRKEQATGLASLVPLLTAEEITPVIDLTVKDRN